MRKPYIFCFIVFLLVSCKQNNRKTEAGRVDETVYVQIKMLSDSIEQQINRNGLLITKRLFYVDSAYNVYLSLDEKFSNWEKAVGEEGLVNDSYILLNQKEASLLKEINLKMIPRYLLYEKDGKLVNINAPGPDSEEIRSFLDEKLE
jgi:hypothetical protein